MSPMSRRRLLATGVGTMAAALATEPAGAAKREPVEAADGLAVIGGDYPKAWFFRQTENTGGYSTFDAWEARFRHLNGIEGKAFLEERDFDDVRTREFFTRFKQRHPEQLVLLHFNGRGRRPDFNPDPYFPGHWLYYAGTRATARVGPNANRIPVRRTAVFRMERPPLLPGMPDDLVIVPPGAGGRPDWAGAEHARLVDIDTENDVIIVRRGQFGTAPIDIPPGSYLAAHVRQRPPAMQPPNALWAYNLSAAGPRNPDGRRCVDVLAAELSGYFRAGAELAAYDGLELDVLFFIPDGRPGGVRFAMQEHLIDIDNDGVPDQVADVGPGFLGGRNVYGLGVTQLCRQLRLQLPGKLLMADGMMPAVHQRSFAPLNGIESEGFPDLRDPDFRDWSGGLNRFEFWKARGTKPAVNYQVFKYVRRENRPGSDPLAYRRLRLALAAAQFTDSSFAIGDRWAPPPVVWEDGGVEVEIFDELWLGTEQRAAWLGQPSGPAVHLGNRATDLLDGAGVSWPRRFTRRWRRDGATAVRHDDGPLAPFVEVGLDNVAPTGTAPDTGRSVHALNLTRVDVDGTDLYVELQLFGAVIGDYPSQISRRLTMHAVRDDGGGEVREISSWFDDRAGTSTFAFRGIGPGRVGIRLEVEGQEPISLARLTAHDHPDVMYREFEHGLVLANPSRRSYTFRLDEIAPGQRFRRLPGSANQDPETNNGERVGTTATVRPIDALFLVKD